MFFRFIIGDNTGTLLILPLNFKTVKVHYGYSDLKFRNPVVTTGIFDGVHHGHRVVIEQIKKRAAELKGETVVVTFHPHPRQVLNQNSQTIQLLTGIEEKISLIEKCGIDHVVLINFDRDLSMMSAADFFEKILCDKIGTKHFVAGFSHHFGRMAEGDKETIRSIADNYGISYEVLEPVKIGGIIVSSSAVREALLRGRIEEANNLLGYDYFMNGKIIEGRKLGRKIGFPTANIKPDYPDKLIPGNGVYAVEIYLKDKKYYGVMSIGYNPTVNRDQNIKSVEVNIFDFEGNIYGEKVCAVFRYRIRDEMVFNTISELSRRIELDRQEALRLLKK